MNHSLLAVTYYTSFSTQQLRGHGFRHFLKLGCYLLRQQQQQNWTTTHHALRQLQQQLGPHTHQPGGVAGLSNSSFGLRETGGSRPTGATGAARDIRLPLLEQDHGDDEQQGVALSTYPPYGLLKQYDRPRLQRRLLK